MNYLIKMQFSAGLGLLLSLTVNTCAPAKAPAVHKVPDSEAETVKQIRRIPEDKRTPLQQAILWVKTDKVEKAKPILEKIIKSEPDNAIALETLGEALFNENLDGSQHKQARIYLTRAVTIAPERGCAFRMLAEMDMTDGNFKKALANCNKALRAERPCRVAHRTKAAALSNLKRYDDALKEMEKYFKYVNRNDNANLRDREMYGACLQDAGKFDEAISFYKSWLSKGYSDMVALSLADCQFKAGKKEDALATISETIRRNQMDELALQRRAGYYLDMQRYKEALNDLNKALELGSNNRLLLQRAKVFEKMGLKEKAAADRRKAGAP
ncbi:MAG: tetratricopeptide repeat protein [Candidatus Obscuribacterales bacterium]|nr:tetratricopeptide repeat protein [Candidatus Obscuribacterales bacterium]